MSDLISRYKAIEKINECVTDNHTISEFDAIATLQDCPSPGEDPGMTNEKVVEVLMEIRSFNDIDEEDYEALSIAIESVKIQKAAEWIPEFENEYTGGSYWFKCSCCGNIVPGGLQSGYKHCPNCGSRMLRNKKSGIGKFYF